MSIILPDATTAGDIVSAALKESGAIGVGQTPSAENTIDGWARLQWLMQGWVRKRWLVYHLVIRGVKSTGKVAYTIGPGPGADIPTAGDWSPADWSPTDWLEVPSPPGAGVGRPDKIESAFLRQIGSPGGINPPDSGNFNSNFNFNFSGGGDAVVVAPSLPNQIDYPLQIIQSMEDYSRIALKSLVSFPGAIFYDPAWPNGLLYPWPVPQANIYAIYVVIKEQLPTSFPTLATKLVLPYEYYRPLVKNLALDLRPQYGLGTYPGDQLPGQAKDALNVLKGANTAISSLQVDPALSRRGIYNIFSDRSY